MILGPDDTAARRAGGFKDDDEPFLSHGRRGISPDVDPEPALLPVRGRRALVDDAPEADRQSTAAARPSARRAWAESIPEAGPRRSMPVADPSPEVTPFAVRVAARRAVDPSSAPESDPVDALTLALPAAPDAPLAARALRAVTSPTTPPGRLSVPALPPEPPASSPITPVRPRHDVDLPPPLRRATVVVEPDLPAPFYVRALDAVRDRLTPTTRDGAAPRRSVQPDRVPRLRHLPWVAAVGVVVLTLAAMGIYVVGRGTATASGSPASTPASVIPRVSNLAPGPGRPAALQAWLESKGFVCTAEASGVDGRLCLLSGPQQTTAYVGGSDAGLGRVTMMTPYGPSAISQEVQDHLLDAALASPDEVAAAKAALAGGTLEKPASLTQGSLAIKGSLGRQLIITAEGWPGLSAPSFGLTPTMLPTVAQQAGYSCTQQSGLIDCTRAIGQMQLTLSGFTGVDDLRYVRLRVTGSDRTVVQQALLAEATAILPQIGGAPLSDAFRTQVSNGTAFAFSGSHLLDFYPATTSGNTVRTTLYVSQSCWTGTALTC